MLERPHTRYDLNSVAVHICYEVVAMRDGIKAWELSSGGVINHLALETFLLHSRNLLDTFHEPRPIADMRVDDVLARDFFDPPGTWDHVRPASVPSTLSGVRERLNKLLSPLTYSRIGYALKDDPDWLWPCRRMAEELERLIRTFLDNLPFDNREFFLVLALEG